MREFVGKEIELNILKEKYENFSIKTCAIYGKRKVGKTRLILEFCKDKRALYLSAINGSIENNIKGFNNAINDFEDKEVESINDFSDLLDYFKTISKDERTVIVIDDFSLLMEKDREIISLLQHFINKDLKSLNLLLIVIGSSKNVMNDIIEGKTKPSVGCFSDSIEIKPLSYKECRNFHPDLSLEDNLKAYMIAGGIPLYHDKMEFETIKENIIGNFFGPSAFLRDKAEFSISMDLSPVNTYTSMICAVVDGSINPREIAEKSKISESLCNRYLNNMESIGLVVRNVPMFGAPKKPTYYVGDKLLAFYHSVVSPNMGLVQTGNPDKIYDKLKPKIDSYYNSAFKEVCHEYVKSHYYCKEIGKWWGKVYGESAEIDLAAIIFDGKYDGLLMGSCLFSDHKMEINTLDTLRLHVSKLQYASNISYILFSKSGFTDELMEYAEDNKVILVSLKDLYKDKIE